MPSTSARVSSSPRSARDCGTNAYTSSGKDAGVERIAFDRRDARRGEHARRFPKRKRADDRERRGALPGRSRSRRAFGARRPSARRTDPPAATRAWSSAVARSATSSSRPHASRMRGDRAHDPLRGEPLDAGDDGGARFLHQCEAAASSSPVPGSCMKPTSSHADPRALGVRAHRLPLRVHRRAGSRPPGARGRRGRCAKATPTARCSSRSRTTST